MGSAGKIFGKTSGIRRGRPVNKHSSFTTIAIGATFWAGYLVYRALNRKK